MQANYTLAEREDNAGAMITEQTQLADKPQVIEINSRFGKISVDTSKSIRFSKGLVGMPDKTEFCITNFPSEKMARFKMLQCVGDQSLSFITLPVDADNEFIMREDIEAACTALDIDRSDLVILLIVSVHRGVSGVRLSVNCVAPLFIDSRQRVATQYVYGNGRYQVRHMIT